MRDSLDPIVVAIMMVYMIQIQFTINSFFSMGATMEEQMVSFNRCNNMISIPQEAEQRKPVPLDEDGDEWISKGKIEFEDYSVRYRPETELVLSNINLIIQAGDKVGVVGRTGAGK